MAQANSARSWISSYKKCIVRRTRCFRKHPAWKVKRWPSLVWDSRSKRKSKNIGSRYRTSNKRRTCKQADGVDRFRAIGIRKIDISTADFANAGNDGFEVLYYQAASHYGIKREML